MSHDRLLKIPKLSLYNVMPQLPATILALCATLFVVTAQEPAAELAPQKVPVPENAPKPNRRPSPQQAHQKALSALDVSHQKLAAAQEDLEQAKASLAAAERAHDEAHAAEVATRPPVEKPKAVPAPEAVPATLAPVEKMEILKAEKRATELKKRAEQLRKNAEKIQEAAAE